MADHRITDFVAPEAIQSLKNLKEEIDSVKASYVEASKELIKGLNMSVNGIDDLEKLTKLFNENQKKSAEATDRLKVAYAEQSKAIGQTTAKIAESLQEQNKLDRAVRQSKVDHEQVRTVLEKVNGTYDQRLKRLIDVQQEMKNNTSALKSLDEQYKKGTITADVYNQKVFDITKSQRELAQEKSSLTTQLKNEEREMNSVQGSYNHLSQELELLKKAYKNLSEEEKQDQFGKDMLTAINQLDTELKHQAEDMGEHQRNVGDYAIALRDGVVVNEDLTRVLSMEAGTIAGCIEQNKALEQAKLNLNTRDANYAETLDKINAKIEENRNRILDVDTVLTQQVTTLAEAEEQNKVLSEALKLVDLTSEGASEKIASINEKIEQNTSIIEANGGSQSSIKKQLKELVLEIATLTVQYQNMSAEEKASAKGNELEEKIKCLTEQAGELKDAIGDVNQAISNAASDTRTFDQISDGVGLMIDGFGLATGASEMLGISQDDLVEIQTKLQASIAASNALSQIQTKLQKQSALMQGVATVQTKASTLAENIKTAAVGKGIIATKAATAAQWLLNQAAMANPYVLLAMAIVTVVGALAIFVSSSNAAKEAQESLNKEIERTNKGIQRINDECDFNVGIAKACGESEEAIRQMRLEAARAANDLAYLNLQRVSNDPNHTKEQYEEAVRIEEETYQKVKQILDEGTFAYLKSLSDKEKADEEAAKRRQEKDAEEYKRAKSAQAIEQNMLKLRLTSLNLQLQVADEFSDEWVDIMERIAQTNNSIKVFDVKEQLANALKDAENSYKLGKITAEEYNQSIEDLTRNANDHLLALSMELSDELAEIQDKMVKHSYEVAKTNIANRLEIVRKGSKEEYDLKLQQLDIEYKLEIDEANKTGADILTIREKYEKLKLDLAVEYANNRIKDIQDEAAAESVIADNAYNRQLTALKKKLAEDLAAVGNNAQKRAEIQKQYEEDVADLTEKYAVQTAKSQIDMIEKMLGVEDLSADERARLEAELAKAKIDLEDAIADAAIASNQRIVDDDNATKEKRIKNAQQWLQVASDSLNAINDLASAIFDAKIANIEAEMDANNKKMEEEESQGEAEQERIDELIQKKVISQEEGEARKRAAEAKTAQNKAALEKKNEELEKKKQQIQYRQAVWDKANKFAQAGISTALGIMQTIASVGFPTAIPLIAMVGAIGALQLATILATPIPKYKSGTDHHKGGLAIVGDGGKAELVFSNGEYFITPDKPTLVDIPQGAKVYPDVDRFIDESVGINSHLLVAGSRDGSSVNVDISSLERKIDGSNELLKAIVYQQKGQHKAIADALYHSDFERTKNSL